ncbi:Acetolactate synthase large subunit [Richelia intracellularis HM01]|nr:Acetolactate synthase large subunit [Richelia intracellularis HM01]
MGFGLPAAMGVKVARPEDEVICISGDASFQMCLQELGTLAQYSINVKTVIINNGWQGMVRQWQQAFYGKRYSCSNMELGMPDIELLTRAYGIKGIVVKLREELSDAITQMLTSDCPVILNVYVTRDENCYPMVAPGKSNSQMLGLAKKEQKANT